MEGTVTVKFLLILNNCLNNMDKPAQGSQNILLALFLIANFLVVSCKNDLDQKKAAATSSKIFQNEIDSAKYRLGESIFKADCNACHASNHGIDNYLRGVVQRVGNDYLKLYLT